MMRAFDGEAVFYEQVAKRIANIIDRCERNPNAFLPPGLYGATKRSVKLVWEQALEAWVP